jgi:hypothetical protein
MAGDEGIIEKAAIADVIYLANSPTKLENNHMITRISNIREENTRIVALRVRMETYCAETTTE